MEVAVLVGLQGAGKSTFVRTRLAATHAHVSKDHFRSNPRPARRQRRLVEEALAAGQSVVVDNTNPTRADRAELIALARQFDAAAVCYYFPPDLEACLRRNAERAGKARVPDFVLGVTLRRLEPPTRAEGFDRILFVRPLEGGGFETTQAEGDADAAG